MLCEWPASSQAAGGFSERLPPKCGTRQSPACPSAVLCAGRRTAGPPGPLRSRLRRGVTSSDAVVLAPREPMGDGTLSHVTGDACEPASPERLSGFYDRSENVMLLVEQKVFVEVFQ